MRGKIDGRRIAEELEEDLPQIDESPRLEIIQAGGNEASKTFVKEKMEAAERIGFEANLTEFGSDVDEKEILGKIDEFNSSDRVDGVLVQLPLPSQVEENKVFEKLSPGKDVDGLTPENLGRTLRGADSIRPAAVEGILEIIEREDVELKGTKVVIVNNSSLIGRPLSMALTQRNATVTICNEETRNLESELNGADIIVTATGEPGIIDPETVPDGSIVIDAGYENGEGDIEKIEEISQKARISPVPNGLGPVTVAYTMKNLLKLCQN